MEEKKVTKQGLKSAIESMYKSFVEENEKEAMTTELYKIIMEEANWVKNPDDFSYVTGKINNIIHTCVSKTFPFSDDTLKHLYSHYNIYESNIRALIEQKEGSCCCCDKTSLIIRNYFKYVKTGELPVFDREKSIAPNFGTEENWMEFVDSITDLIYGKPIKFLNNLATLAES